MDQSKLERAYRTFVRCHQVAFAATDEAQLLEQVCLTAVTELGFELAWIGLVTPADHVVRPVAQAGYEAGYLESIAITWSDDEHGWGPTGRAIRGRAPCVSRDIARDEKYAPWRADALRRGYASSAAIPLFHGADCLGAFNLYASEPDAFDDDEIALLEEMAVDLVLGLVRLRGAIQLREIALRAERAATAEAAGAVAVAMAHDVNNLLQVITLSIDSARRARDAAQRDEALDDAAIATSSAVSLMRRSLSLHRRALESVAHANVDQVVMGMRPLLERLAPRAVLDLRLASAGVQARIAPLDLERILINLAVNAGHVVAEGGAVSISSERRTIGPEGAVSSTGRLLPGSYVVVSCADSGPGIRADVLPRIFDPFFTTKGEAGTGLGLPSVLHLARAAGGSVSVESPSGGGARFSVFLPTDEG